MANMSIRGVTCPVCNEGVTVRASGYGGCPGYSGYSSYNGAGHPGDPPELHEVEEILFEECLHDISFLVGEQRRNDPASCAFWAEVDRQIEEGIIEVDEYEPFDPEWP